MIRKSDSYTVETIFKEHYKIPPYQRGYAWQKEQWENLFNDILENEKGYFLGSLICINDEADNYFDVIDGQQRLTTITLLKNALLKTISNRWELSVQDRIKSRQFNQLEYSIYDSDNSSLRLSLSIQNNNQEDYLYLAMSENAFDPESFFSKAPPNFGTRRINKAYKYFSDRFNEVDSEGKKLFDLEELFAYHQKLDSALLVRIDVRDLNSAFILFESINNRGIPLTPIDLIKNAMIANIDEDPEKTNEKWQIIIDNVEGYADQIRFLRHYYHAFYFDPKVQLKSFSKAGKADIIKIYETHIKNKSNAPYIFEQLIDKSKIYQKFITPEKISAEDKDYRYKAILQDLQHLGVAPGYALLLHLFSEYSDMDLMPMIRMVEKWFIRRHITDFPATRFLDQIFLKLLKSIEVEKDKVGFDIENFVEAYLFNEKLYSTDEKLRSYLYGNIYEDNYTITRYLLIKLENSLRNEREEKIDFWEMQSKNQYLWTVEHVLPQKPDAKSKWDQHFTAEQHTSNVHRLGNLTLSGYNASLSNNDFSVKKAHPNGFATGRVKINEYIANQDVWSLTNIEERTKDMIQKLLEMI
jgi:uncharacterized protein with ParB-like and HNH nuclease domain